MNPARRPPRWRRQLRRPDSTSRDEEVRIAHRADGDSFALARRLRGSDGPSVSVSESLRDLPSYELPRGEAFRRASFGLPFRKRANDSVPAPTEEVRGERSASEATKDDATAVFLHARTEDAAAALVRAAVVSHLPSGLSHTREDEAQLRERLKAPTRARCALYAESNTERLAGKEVLVRGAFLPLRAFEASAFSAMISRMASTKNKRASEEAVERLALSRRSAARAIDRSEGYLRLRERHGDGPPFTRCGKAVFYPVDGLKEWLKTNCNCGGAIAPEERRST